MNTLFSQRRIARFAQMFAMIGAAIGAIIPMSAFAEDDLFTIGRSSAVSLLDLVHLLSQIAFAATLLFFFWGIAIYIYGGAEDHKRGKNMMIWGVLAIFVAASVWGLVAVLRTTFGISQQSVGVIPKIGGGSSSDTGNGI
jgi:hypothetical protein